MGAHSYEELAHHVGHKIVCVKYGNGVNVAVECETCNCVLMDFDKPAKGHVICPECRESYEKDGDGHNVDAIEKYGKCCDCLGSCPYCKEDSKDLEFTPPGVEVEMDHVTIQDEHGEIVHWIDDEWNEDPSEVTPAIANCIKMYYEEGPEAIRKLLGKEVKADAGEGRVPD